MHARQKTVEDRGNSSWNELDLVVVVVVVGKVGPSWSRCQIDATALVSYASGVEGVLGVYIPPVRKIRDTFGTRFLSECKYYSRKLTLTSTEFAQILALLLRGILKKSHSISQKAVSFSSECTKIVCRRAPPGPARGAYSAPQTP